MSRKERVPSTRCSPTVQHAKARHRRHWLPLQYSCTRRARSTLPVDAVLSTCSSLLAIVDVQNPSRKVIQFSHFSVKEYLTSPRLAEANDIIPRRYHVSMTPAHTLAAQICLGILLHLDKDVVTRENLEKWPLAKYAAKH